MMWYQVFFFYCFFLRSVLVIFYLPHGIYWRNKLKCMFIYVLGNCVQITIKAMLNFEFPYRRLRLVDQYHDTLHFARPFKNLISHIEHAHVDHFYTNHNYFRRNFALFSKNQFTEKFFKIKSIRHRWALWNELKQHRLMKRIWQIVENVQAINENIR